MIDEQLPVPNSVKLCTAVCKALTFLSSCAIQRPVALTGCSSPAPPVISHLRRNPKSIHKKCIPPDDQKDQSPSRRAV